jgi:hypothetical protein
MKGTVVGFHHKLNTTTMMAARAMNTLAVNPSQRESHLAKNNATKALEDFTTRLPVHEYKRAAKPENKLSSLLRSSKKGAFDIDDLVAAARPVQESVEFPIIEWSLDDDYSSENDKPDEVWPKRSLRDLDDDEDDDLREPFSRLGKRDRGCSVNKRLVRSKALRSDLSLLESPLVPLSRSFGVVPERPKSPTDFSINFDLERRVGSSQCPGKDSSPSTERIRSSTLPSTKDETVNTIHRGHRHAISTYDLGQAGGMFTFCSN